MDHRVLRSGRTHGSCVLMHMWKVGCCKFGTDIGGVPTSSGVSHSVGHSVCLPGVDEGLVWNLPPSPSLLLFPSFPGGHSLITLFANMG